MSQPTRRQMWAWGFTTAALSWSAVLYDLTIDTALRCVGELIPCIAAAGFLMRWLVRLKGWLCHTPWLASPPTLSTAARCWRCA